LTVPVLSILADTRDAAESDDPSGVTDGHNRPNDFPRAVTGKEVGRGAESIDAVLAIDETDSEFGPGDQIILHNGDPCSRTALRGRVSNSENGQLRIRLRNASYGDCAGLMTTGRSEDFEWFVDRIPFSRGREVSRQALFGFFTRADPSVVRVVVRNDAAVEPGADENSEPSVVESPSGSIREGHAGEESEESASPRGNSSPAEQATGAPPDFDDLCFSEGLQSELNEDQEDAIRAALASETFHLIHGPPGTGKTRVLARLVRMCMDRGERVLVACPTNVALDRVLVSLIDLGVREFLRVGARSTVSREFMQARERLGNPPLLLEDLAALDISFSDFRRRVRQAQLIGATAYQCAAHPLFLRQHFDRVVIDEAGQVDEPAGLAPLALAPRFVLGGDHLQLPPVAQGVSRDPEVTHHLEKSLFERLFPSSPAERISRLKMQYRMNSEIQDVPSRLFYGGTLFPSPEAASRRLSIDSALSDDSDINSIVDPDRPVVFVDVEGAGSGRARPEEALVASRIVECLLKAGLPPGEIGVITPYRVQQALIRRSLSSGPDGGTLTPVNTVDRFQGGEKEVIILSLARSDGVTSFLADRKRLNVSLSRARSKLILLGHGPVLREHPLFESMLEGLERIPISPGAALPENM